MREWLMLCGLALLAACSSIDCPVDNTVETCYAVYDSQGAELTMTDTLSVLTFRNDGSDTLLLNRHVGSSSFYLPISYSHPEDELYFVMWNDSVFMVDTVWIKKDDYPHFESVDCTVAFFHTITGVRYTTNGIDSIGINHSTVNYDGTTAHFHFYPKSSH